MLVSLAKAGGHKETFDGRVARGLRTLQLVRYWPARRRGSYRRVELTELGWRVAAQLDSVVRLLPRAPLLPGFERADDDGTA